jgi:hypothetical protein
MEQQRLENSEENGKESKSWTDEAGFPASMLSVLERSFLTYAVCSQQNRCVTGKMLVLDILSMLYVKTSNVVIAVTSYNISTYRVKWTASR